MRNSIGANCYPTTPAFGIDLGNRLKKVQGKKKRDAEAAEALKRQLTSVEAAAQMTDPEYGDAAETGDLLSTKDDDVIF